jgi:hypothetical protein
MKTILFKSGDRGKGDYGWLQANYSFSFANYRDPERDHFGALRVLNDDFIKGGAGFGEHPHRDMEIISIPLKGGLKHKDSMSNSWIPLMAGEVQVMSAGTGVVHAEKNASSDEVLNLFQIWVIPERRGFDPGYAQKVFSKDDRQDKLQVLVTDYKDPSEGALKIHQDALISRLDLSKDNAFEYQLKSDRHGVYMMIISGEVDSEGKTLESRDAMGIWDTDQFKVAARATAEILFIEVPMYF